MTVSICPSRNMLMAYVEGIDSASEASEVDAHLAKCPNCAGWVEQVWQGGDLVAQALRVAAEAGDFEREPACAAAVHAAASLPESTGANNSATDHGPAPAQLPRIREYELLEKVGEGGMGAVYKARHGRLKRFVAIKLLRHNRLTNSDAVVRFEREMEAVGRLDHPHIVRALDAGEDTGTQFLAMEYVDGLNLSQMVRRLGPLPAHDACELIRQAALGLQHAHEHNLVHRDIKPSNLMINQRGMVKVLDLGLARLRENKFGADDITSTGQIMGTVDYIAPEQATDTHAADIRADIYSLGCTLYHLLAGHPPFRSDEYDSAMKKLLAHSQTPHKPISQIRTGLPTGLPMVLDRMLAKKREDRFATPEDVAAALATLAKGSRPIELFEQAASVPESQAALGTPAASSVRNMLSATYGPATGQPSAKAVAPPATTHATDRFRSRRLWAFATGCVTLCLLAAIIITITNKDGTKSTIKLPEGFAADINAAPGSKVTITQSDTVSSPQSSWYGWPTDAPKPAIAPFNAVQAKKHQEEWAAYLKVPVEYTNSIGMKFRLIPPGEFMMGSTWEEIDATLQESDLKNQADFQRCVRSEAPLHKVILTQAFYLGVNEVTQVEYDKVMGSNPSHFAHSGAGKNTVAAMETTAHPVEMVNWYNVTALCTKLNQQEKHKPLSEQEGKTIALGKAGGYRLPSEAEWEFACRAGTTTKYWIGTENADVRTVAWVGLNSGGHTHRVGAFPPNPFGLFDVLGNVSEWVQDGWDAGWYKQVETTLAINPKSPMANGIFPVFRGGNWSSHDSSCRSGYRHALPASLAEPSIGFRLALTVDTVRTGIAESTSNINTATGWHGWPADAPKPAIAPFDAARAKQHQDEWAAYLKVPVEYTSSIGMKFRLIPPGEFTMGSTPEEIAAALKEAGEYKHWRECIQSEAPQHKVILTQPIYLGVNEVTQAEYEKVMGVNPSHFAPMGMGKEAVAGLETAEHPVERVSWNDAAEFCAKLSQKEKLKPFYFRAGETITPLDGTGYRLPSEAEWEFACRAGTATKYWIGDKDEDLVPVGWFGWGGNSGGRTHAAGELKANPFGLSDIHGNVWEWVQDGWDATCYGQFQDKPAINPSNPFSAGTQRVFRGGSWLNTAPYCRSSYRDAYDPPSRFTNFGFRVSLPVDAVRTATTNTTKAMGAASPPDRDRLVTSFDRQIATWLVQHGGIVTVEVSGSVRDVRHIDQLPTSEFQATHIRLDDLDATIPLEKWSQLAALPKLVGIVCRTDRIRPSEDEFAALSKSTSITGIDFRCETPVALEQIAKFSTLTNVDLARWAIADQDLLRLRPAKSLVMVTLPNSITDDGLRNLQTAVPRLSWVQMAANHKITSTGLQHLPNLESLTIGGHHVTKEFGEALVTLPKLKQLQVWPPDLADRDFSPFSPLKLELLEWFSFGDSNAVVRDEHIASLMNLPNIKQIVVQQQPIEDRHAPLFVNAATGQTLKLFGTRLTTVGIAQIRNQLPQCTIETDVK